MMATESRKEYKKPCVSMATVVRLLNIGVDGASNSEAPLLPTDVSSINCLCPKCKGLHTSKRQTLHIDYESNVFSCARCGYSGGVYDFVSFYTGWPKEEVQDRIKKGELKNYVPKDGEVDDAETTAVGISIAPVKRRDEVYREMLGLMQLQEFHRQDLLARGLTNEQIDKIGFKSYIKYQDFSVIPKKLIARGFNLAGVPGFGLQANGEWAMAKLPDSGFLIPVKNGNDKIQGFQIRFNHKTNSIPKYGYFTSGKMVGGTKCSPWPCWVGEKLTDKNRQVKPFDVILIEGPLKAYIVNALTGANVIAVPGVNALGQIPNALQAMQQYGLNKVLVAYDMDSYDNPVVDAQLQKLFGILSNLSIPAERMVWDRNYKGLDDYLVSKK